MADDTLDNTDNGQPPDQSPDISDDWANALSEQENENSPQGGSAARQSQPPAFQELGEGDIGQSTSQNLDFLLDVPLEVTVEMGRTNMVIKKMLQLTQGSVVELDKAAGEPVEIFVNNKLLGKGEVIVVNDRFGVRITEIISQADRIKNIG